MKKQWLPRWVVNLAGDIGMRLLQKPLIAKRIEAAPSLHNWLNKKIINSIVGRARFRPHPFSTKTPYTSWSSLTDKTWSGRHLGVSKIVQKSLPDPEGLEKLFERPDGEQRMCPKSTCLFPAFAQYLTDGFMRTNPEKDPHTGVSDPENRKRNTSNHEIDMCTLYGRTPEQTRALRVVDPGPGERGMLRSQKIGDEEYPPFLFKDGQINPDFDALDPPLGLQRILEFCANVDPQDAEKAEKVRDAIFAVGGDRVNTVPQVSMINTLWLREHNRLARELGRKKDYWDDDRVFETARNIVIVQFIKIVVEDYINHISPLALSMKADPSVAWNAPWNKPNWLTTEFSLLYRWHALIPDHIAWDGKKLPVKKESYFLNNRPLLKGGLKRGFVDMSTQAAAELGPRNTAEDLLELEMAAIRQGRICQLESYNAYRKYLGQDPVKRFEEISSDPKVTQLLSKAYGGDVNKVDFYVGIFCEDRKKNSPLPPTISDLVGVDAFSQALTNPLLSKHVFAPPNKDQEHPTFTQYGWEQIKACSKLRDIVARNVSELDTSDFIAMTRKDWKRE